MADLISRAALVNDLRAFRDSLGDVVFKMVVDRIVERVEALPAFPICHELQAPLREVAPDG